MATTRMAVGSILGTVTDTANAVSDLVKTTGLGIGMLNNAVLNMSVDQKERQVAHRATFRSTIVREASMEIAKGNAEALAFCRESEDNKTLFETAQSQLLTAFENYDGSKPK